MTGLLALALATPVICLLLLLGMAWTEKHLDILDAPDLSPSERVPGQVHVQVQLDVPSAGLALAPQRA